MKRRAFLAAAGASGLAALKTSPGADAAESAGNRQLYELRQYAIGSKEQGQGLAAFLRDAAIPAFNRIGVQPVGVFQPAEGISPVYVLLPHASLESVITSTQRLLADAEYLAKGEAFLNAAADEPAYQRIESSLLLAFQGMPALETPSRVRDASFNCGSTRVPV